MVSLKIFILIPSPISLHMPFQSIRLFILHISSACMPVWSYVPSVISLLCYMPVQSHVFLYICLFWHMPAQSHIPSAISLFHPHAYSVICLSCTYVSFVHTPLLPHACSVTCPFSPHAWFKTYWLWIADVNLHMKIPWHRFRWLCAIVLCNLYYIICVV